MSLFALVLLQVAVPALPPAVVKPPVPALHVPPGGSFPLKMASLPADKLEQMSAILDGIAARRCGVEEMTSIDQTYDQSTDSDGNPSPTITDLQQNYKCPEATAPAPATTPSP